MNEGILKSSVPGIQAPGKSFDLNGILETHALRTFYHARVTKEKPICFILNDERIFLCLRCVRFLFKFLLGVYILRWNIVVDSFFLIALCT